MKFNNFKISALITGTLFCSTVFSQDATLDPSYGSLDLAAGFIPDPQLIETIAGGVNYAGDIDFSCYGYVDDAPTFRLNYDGNGQGLGIYTIADIDTTLLINTPDGEWVCNDDHFNLEDLNAGYFFENPQAGEYNIWVGVYSEFDASSDATLAITEFQETDWADNLISTFTQGIYRLRVLNNGNEVQTGVATLVEENVVLSNAALVSQGDQWIVEDSQSGAALVANLDVIDETSGLALLNVNGLEGIEVVFATEFPEISRNISLALPDATRQGVLHSIVDEEDLQSQIRHTALVEEGEYGAALLNNCGEVIGLSQHSSPVLSNRLRPDEDFAFSTNLNSLFDFLIENNVDFFEAFDICLSEAEQLSLAEEKIQEQEEALIILLEEQFLLEEEQQILEEERLRLQEETERLQQEQEALAIENQARLDELAAREAELEASQAVIEEAEARQQELEEQAREQEEALAEAAAQQIIDERNRLYQWTGFGAVVIALFGFVVFQVKRRKKVQIEAEENINEVKEKSERIESELQKASAEFSDIVLLGTDESGAESRLKIIGNALIRSENGQIIGRSAQHADYVLNLETISRQHLHIAIKEISHTDSTENKMYVKDLNSSNGSAINGTPLQPNQEYELNPGDTLKIGLITYTVNLLES